jgi:hypothetical protein
MVDGASHWVTRTQKEVKHISQSEDGSAPYEHLHIISTRSSNSRLPDICHLPHQIRID